MQTSEAGKYESSNGFVSAHTNHIIWIMDRNIIIGIENFFRKYFETVFAILKVTLN